MPSSSSRRRPSYGSYGMEQHQHGGRIGPPTNTTTTTTIGNDYADASSVQKWLTSPINMRPKRSGMMMEPSSSISVNPISPPKLRKQQQLF